MIKKLLTGFLTGSVVFSLSALDIVTDGIARIELESGQHCLKRQQSMNSSAS